ncbi:BTAD domain-containing putative transcriptional regulator [Streptomyces sp. NPDC057743]|uniref:AfsR/SARP family transcriptional regulator n=1 Tax=Streptomyces sp. NPDC057743 TaxID=3346236 RepID=UPI0036AD691E
MRFNLIGPFEVVADDSRAYTPSAPKVCKILALLLICPNEIVTSDSLIRELWGERPPRRAMAGLQTYVYSARKMFIEEGLAPSSRTLLVTKPTGYLIRVTDGEVDTVIFERLLKQGHENFREGRYEPAIQRLDEALSLWRGPVLSNVPVGDVLTCHTAHLEELRIRALELRIDAEHHLGRQRETIPELRSLVNEYPFNEWFHGQLISALNCAGRRAEALQAYRQVHRILDKELGLEPSRDLQRLLHKVLNN